MMPPVFRLLAGSAAVTALVGSSPVRVFRSGRAPQNCARPYITWAVITGVPAAALDLPVIDNFRVQVDCWAETGAQCDALAQAAQDALEADGENVMVSQNIDGVDPATLLFRNSKDFSFWVNRSP